MELADKLQIEDRWNEDNWDSLLGDIKDKGMRVSYRSWCFR